MSTVATLWVKLGLDSKGYSQGLKSAAEKTQKVGKTMMAVGATATAGLTLPIVAAGVAATKMASDLEQSIGGVESIFKDTSATIFEFGETAAEAVGLSQREFNQLATISGAFLKNVGFSLDETGTEVIQLTERAADMAATFGGPVSGAMNAIQSALKGEFNPLENFGVKMNAAAIEARALALGLTETTVDSLKLKDANVKALKAQENYDKVMVEFGDDTLEATEAAVKLEKAQKALTAAYEGEVGPITDAMKAQAALDILYEQTSDTVGQFARESDTLAGQTERVKAKFENTAAALGTKLLPIGLKIMEFLSGLIDRFTALNPEQQKTILIVAGIVAAIGPLVTIVGGLITAFGAILPVLGAVAGVLTGPVGLAIAAIIAIVILLKKAWDENFGGIQEKVQKVFAIIRSVFDAFKAAFAGDWESFGALLRQAWDMAWALILTTLIEIGLKVGPIINNMINNIISFFQNVDWANLGRNIVLGIGRGLASMGGWIAQQARNVASAALAAAKGFLGIRSPSKAFGELGKFSAMGFGEQFQKTMTGFQPQMAMSMSVPAASVATPAGNGISASDLQGMKPEPMNYRKQARAMRDIFLKETA